MANVYFVNGPLHGQTSQAVKLSRSIFFVDIEGFDESTYGRTDSTIVINGDICRVYFYEGTSYTITSAKADLLRLIEEAL